jgi:uroporphyrin-III C-methyltransferase
MGAVLSLFHTGAIALVGAGPGDPDLLTIKALRALKAADVVVYDGLVSSAILALAPAAAERISVAKQRDRHTLSQDDINTLLVTRARQGKFVVRLKGGDPFVFGRGGEEVEAARAAGVAIDVIPGITAATGCAAQAVLPLTHRDHSSVLSFVAGQRKDLEHQDWSGLAGRGRTLVIYMGLATAAEITEKLIADGVAHDQTVAILEKGTRPEARVLKTTLFELAMLIEREAIESPALLVVGDVAALAEERDGRLAALSLDLITRAAE